MLKHALGIAKVSYQAVLISALNKWPLSFPGHLTSWTHWEETGWVQEPVWMLWKTARSLPSARNTNPSIVQPIT